ncbi:AzlC family ABC transporter permease [Delftia sp. NA_296.1]|jgi:4-azaleucine resistance transporter AzlC|uniref:AzlC family ABC transporter permease n=1 Tax=Delftia TaxID=80865 RepID=UPI00020E805F|nr:MULTISPECIES: AzlC family ABC transporter permease [Delftia]AEF90075.1 AzlC family protein [Delftia sp. Cs1-4]KEH06851.1 branched-chain amino acid ABC transporter permease [Delftia tsuruhatensis]MCG3784956.1 AzlC family ABC transporter permease [Delftia acidovorans]MCX7508694.1 AzlC family ABC transporter permease [Delftia tsuruhatensis]MDH0422300.1 AzlC family ABC transporter permease [Delftia tsuruhatensis]
MSSSIPLSPAAVSADSVSRSSEAFRGFRDAIPVMLGFVPFALVLGAQAVQKGLAPLEVPLMTGMNFGGGSEFTAIRLWTSPPHVLLIVAMSFLVNCRHILMGAALAPYLRHLPRRRALPALFFMCDESWALALADAQRSAARRVSLPYYMGVSAGLYMAWVSCTAAGAFLGPRIGDLEQYGFDMAFTAVFLVLLRGMWKGVRPCRPWLVSLLTAALVYKLVPGAWYVAAGAVSGLVCAALLAPRS